MTTVAAILASAARQCSVPAPSAWATATEPQHVELRDDFLRETADDLIDRVDWPQPIGQTVAITGNGSMNYAMPADFRRLMRDKYAVYERQRTRRECIPVVTDGEWEYMQELGTAGAYRFYRLKGYESAFTMDFYREPSAGETIVINYVSDVWALSNGGARQGEFLAETDVCLFPRRLVETGIVWRFRKRRGLEYGDVLAEYEMLMGRALNDKRTRRTIAFGHVEGRQPWDVPIPDVIPSS